jgi:ferredoxin
MHSPNVDGIYGSRPSEGSLIKERMLTMAAKIDSGKCTGCGKCISACPMEVIEIHDGKAVISDGCVECGVCVSVCPNGAITL